MTLPEALAPLRSKYFRIYWCGQAISLTGTWMQQMTLGWVVTRLTSSALIVGALGVTSTLPIGLLSLTGGQMADRRSRRNVLLVTQVLMMSLAFGLAALAFTDRLGLPHLFVFSALLGATTAFDLPAAQAFAPELVPRADIPRAVALIQSIFHGSRLVGPAIAGLCIARFGEGSALLANAISFAAVIISLAAIPADRPATAGRRGPGGPTAGIQYLRQEPVTRALFGLLALCMLLVFPFVVVLMPYYAKYVVVADASGMGTIMSSSGFGALAGAAALVAFGGRSWRGRIGVGAALIGAGLAGLGSTSTLPLAVMLTLALSLGTSLYLGTITQVVQQRVPSELRGRVMALFGIGMTTVTPLSGLTLAWAADRVGLPRLMIGCGIAFACAAAMLALRLPRQPSEPPSIGDDVATI